MDINNLSEPEKAALAKAQSVGVTSVNKDGSTTEVSALTQKVAPAANASGDVKPAGTAAATPEAAAGDKPQRPTNVPEKFWDGEKGAVNTEALLKSYGELERARSAARPQEMPTPPAMGTAPPAATPSGTTPPAEGTPEAAAAKVAADGAATATARAAAEAAAVTARQEASDAATADIARDGKISDGTYAKLAAAGYDRGTVDAYIEGQQAKATLQLNAMHDLAGGKSDFDKMVAWGAAGNYTPAEVAAFDTALRSGDKGQQALAVNGLKSRYSAEFGKGGKTVNTLPSNTSASNAFKSQRELTEAMNDVRYKKGDPTFHREVAERVAASQRAGIDIGIRVI